MPNLEARLQALEANQGRVQELIDLLEDVQSALRVFVKLANALKWVSILVASITGGVLAIRKWF